MSGRGRGRGFGRGPPHHHKKEQEKKAAEKKKREELERKEREKEIYKRNFTEEYYAEDKTQRNQTKLISLRKKIRTLQLRIAEEWQHFMKLYYIVKRNANVLREQLAIETAFNQRYSEEIKRIRSQTQFRSALPFGVRQATNYLMPVDPNINLEPRSKWYDWLLRSNRTATGSLDPNIEKMIDQLTQKVDKASVDIKIYERMSREHDNFETQGVSIGL